MKYFVIYIIQRGWDSLNGTSETVVNYIVSTEDKNFVETLGLIKAGKGFQPAIKSVFLDLDFPPCLGEEEEEDHYPLQWEDCWLTYGEDLAWQLTRIEELTENEYETLTKFHIGINITHKQKGA